MYLHTYVQVPLRKSFVVTRHHHSQVPLLQQSLGQWHHDTTIMPPMAVSKSDLSTGDHHASEWQGSHRNPQNQVPDATKLDFCNCGIPPEQRAVKYECPDFVDMRNPAEVEVEGQLLNVETTETSFVPEQGAPQSLKKRRVTKVLFDNDIP